MATIPWVGNKGCGKSIFVPLDACRKLATLTPPACDNCSAKHWTTDTYKEALERVEQRKRDELYKL